MTNARQVRTRSDALVLEWFRTLRAGDAAARARIILEHRWLVVVCARRLQRHRETLDDLVQVGYVGLIKAVDRFDPGRGVPFRAYASATIMGELRHHYRSTWRMRTPRRIQELNVAVARARDQLTGELGRPPTVAEIAESAGSSEEAVVEVLDANMHRYLVSLSDTGTDWHPGSGQPNGVDDAGFDAAEDRVTVTELLAELPEPGRSAVFLRYFHDLTQDQIAARLGVSQVTVSRLISGALHHLRAECDPFVA